MSGKGPPGRSKRSEKDTFGVDSKHEGNKGKYDSKHGDSRDRSSSNLSDGRSPSHGRSDRNHNNTKDGGKPYPRSKDRGHTGQDGRRRDGDKKSSSGAKHGRDGDGMSNHHPPRDSTSSDGNNKKHFESKMFSDESRLSKLVRRILREDERDRRTTAIRQLKEFILLPENYKSVTKMSDNLLGTLLDIFYEKTYREVKLEATRCIGAVGTVLGGDNDRYLQWLFAKLTSAHTDEAKILLLSALLQTLKHDEEKQAFSESMSTIVSNCQSVLENADQPELLTAVIDVILHVVKMQPYVFNNHFRDTVDILVGWHIDSTQKESLTQYTSDALIKFHQFWVADLQFSVTLLGQFLEDMEAYAEDLSLGLSEQAPMDDDMPSPDECVSKIANLLRVFTTVMKSLGEYFTPARGPPVTTTYIIDTLERVIKCVENSNKSMYSERVTTAANNCLEVLVLNLKADAVSAVGVLQPYIMDQFVLKRQLSHPCLLSLLGLTQTVVEEIGIQLPVPFMKELLSSGSLALRLRFTMNVSVLGALMAVYTSIMGLKSVALLEETYRHLLGDLQIAYSALLESCESDYDCHLVSTNPYPDVSYTTQQAEVAIVFNVCALAEVGNTKNNLIGMWALSPSIFELLTRHLIPAQCQLRGRHPSTQYALLQTLHSHSSRHGHFISSSTLITRNTVREGSVLANVSSATAGHFTIVLSLIADHLSASTTPDDLRLLLMRWVMEISEALINSQHIYLTSEFLSVFDRLIQLGYVQESSTALSVSTCLSTILSNMARCPPLSLKRCVDLCMFRLTDSSPRVRDGYLSLLKAIPINITTRTCAPVTSRPRLEKSTSHVRTARNITSVWAARRSHMAKVAHNTFHSHNFRTVMAYILNNIPPSKMSGSNWLERMFYSSQRLDKDREGRDDFVPLTHVVDDNDGQLWFWATWEAAQFCVLAKLRTPLGKPHDTFTTIEAAIKRYASEVRNRDLDDSSRPTEESKDVGVPSYVAQQRVSLLLQFMEPLEKLLYNAYEGCATAMVAPPKAVRTFFRNNRGTCQEWLTRVRHPLTLVALHSGQPAVAIRQASERLHEMTEAGLTNSTEFEHMLMYMVKALVDTRCPEAVMGLYVWCKDILNKRLTWIKAMADLALGRYESGAVELKSALRQHVTPDSSVEDVKDGCQSPAIAHTSPCHSPQPPSFITDGMQKLSILSKQPVTAAAAAVTASAVSTDSHLPDATLGNFMVDQVCSSYLALRSWDEVMEWQETIQQYRSEHSGSPLQKAFYMHADINFIKALSKFDEHDFEGVVEALDLVPGASLADFTTSDTSSLSGEGVWSRPTVLDTIQKQLVRAATYIHTETYWKENNSSISRCIEEAEELCQGVLRLGAGEWPTVVSPALITQLHMSSVLSQAIGKQKQSKDVLSWCDDLGSHSHEHDVGTMLTLLTNLNLKLYAESSNGDKNTGTQASMSQLRLTTARLSRKSHNYQLAERLLVREAENSLKLEVENGKTESVLGMLTGLHQINGTQDEIHLLKMEREGAKLLHSRGQTREAADMLTSTILAHVSPSESLPQAQEVGELVSRSICGLVQWLQMDHKSLSSLASQLKLVEQGEEANVARAAKNVQALIDIEKTTHKVSGNTHGENEIVESLLMSDSDALVGRLLSLSTHQSPGLAKAWFSLAGWCYKWGRKAVDSASNGVVELTTEEKAQVLNLLPKGTSNEETESVLTILSQVHAGVTGDEDISDQDQSLYDEGAETTRRQLLSSCLSLQIASDDAVERLLEVWREVVRRVYHYYQMAARAYFTFLKLNSQVSEDLGNMDGNITATLRLLRLLVKHAWELREVLEDGLAHTPTAPWKGIIPQLFSRLNHPEAYVRQSVSELLCRVAQDAPHLIVYPAVVGCNSHTDVKDTREGLLSKYLEETDVEIEEGESSQVEEEEEEATTPDEDPGTADSTMLQNCFTAIVDTLAHHNPRMISEVELLVSELRRITLLWDELWLGTLNQHHHDVIRRLMQLDTEVKKVNVNNNLSREEKASLIHEKHVTILKPTVFTMERLVALTNAPAETPHEQWFQTTYGPAIKEALEKLKNPTNPALPHTSWAPFKQLHRNLTDRAQKRSSLILTMDQISNKLGALRNTVIAMPGINTSGQVVTIDAIHQAVQILPTKTKPKKLVFIGSDGKKYPYLFKGLEDLHLDERIMQFLSIVNNMFAKANKGERRVYHARHYSVTPLGARSGLIQWVDGATPLFSLYKRWQQREAMAQQLKLQQQPGPSPSSSTAPSAPTIPRPSDVFYNKLTPALKEKGISNLESRKEWPLSVMRQVLQELMNDTPQDLLARELWCSSTSAAEWWSVTQTYARSTAVMSMIGYIIGLGDRHLDNLLVDLITGEVVHIDYNVCFEKGKGLRVPEKVPFRMTPNIEAALGVTGVEGMFRISCEHVIKTMRKGRETLLTLLEAFVYDPLVDWTTSNEGGYTGAFYGGGQTTSAMDGQQTKKDMERDITLSMFSIRMAEMKSAWITNREDMLSCLPNLQEAVEAFFKIHRDQMELDQNMKQYNNQLLYIEEALKDPHHALYSLPQRFEDFAMVRATRQDAELGIQDKLNECDHWHNTHKYAFSVVQGSRLQKLCSDVSLPLPPTLPGFSSVYDFLQGAGQAHLVTQCEAIESELQAVLHQRRTVLHSCLDVLHTFAKVVSQFPPSYITESRTCRWQQWLQSLVCDFTLQRCKDIVAEFQDHYGLTATPHPATPAILNMESTLQTIIGDGNARLMKVAERRTLDVIDTSRLALLAQESTTAVHQYMHEHGMAGVMCMSSVVVSALCSLSKRYLIMEGAAAAAADRLMDLTSREGDWFLDELSSMSGNVNHLLHLVTDNSLNPLLSHDSCQRISTVMNLIHIVYLALQDLYINFRSIIVPEAAKTMSRGDPTVAASLDALYRIIEEPQRSLDTLMVQLEAQLRNAAIGTEVDPEPVNVVKHLRQRFSELLQGEQVNDEAINLTPGQMLLMGFNGLFTRLDAEFSAVVDAINNLDVPDTWRKVDVVREARILQTISLTDQNMSLLSHLFFVKQLRAMTDFFHLCRTSVNSMHSLSGGVFYDDEQLSQPIKHFIAEYVRKHVMGLPSQTLGYVLCMLISSLHVDVTAEIELHDVGAESKVSIETLCKKVVDTNLKNGAFEHRHLTHASTLLGTVDVAWRKSDLARRLDGNISLLKGSIQRSQRTLSRYHWLYEDIFTKAGHIPAQVYTANRQTILSELRKDMQTLMSHEGIVNAIQERHASLEASINQRLKWAAGANPSLTQVLHQFEEALNARNLLIQNENSLSNEVISVSNSVLHFESLRTRTSDAITGDTSFLQLINRCEESCMLIETCATSVTDTEEALYNLKPLSMGEKVTPQWISTVQQQVAMATADLQIKIGKLSGAADSGKDGVKQQVAAIRTVLAAHHKLMSDIRSILKSMAKQEEYDYGPESVVGGIREYVNTYKSFSENFTSMLKLVMRDDLSPLHSHEITAMMSTLNDQILEIYDDLVNFAPPLLLHSSDDNQEDNSSFANALKKPLDSLQQQQAVPGSPKKLPVVVQPRAGGERLGTPPTTASPSFSATKMGTPTIRRPDKVARDPRTGKAVQERNSYAVGVWRRVKLKLDGRDPDQNKRFSVADQVDYVIREATNLDNLAVLYEGWTPWV